MIVRFTPIIHIFSGTTLIIVSTTEVQSAPTVGLYDQLPDDNGPFLYLYIDPTPYGDNGTVDALQMLQTDLTLSSTKNNNTNFYALTSDKAPVAPYIAPDPIVGPATHHYTLLLFRQPDNFSIPEEFRDAMPLDPKNYTNRIGFALPEFVRQAWLEQPVAAMYFDVSRSNSSSSTAGNSTSTSGGGTTTARASAATRSVVSSSAMLLLLCWTTWMVCL